MACRLDVNNAEWLGKVRGFSESIMENIDLKIYLIVLLHSVFPIRILFTLSCMMYGCFDLTGCNACWVFKLAV